MKAKVTRLVFSFVVSLLLFACQQNPLGISKIKVGEEKEQRGYVGQQLPVHATINSEIALEQIELTVTSSNNGSDWKLSEILQENTDGKKDIKVATEFDIPASTKPGKYTLTIKAVKHDGTFYQASQDFNLSVDSSLPTVSDLDLGLNSAKNDLHLEAEINAAKKIKQITLAIRGKDWDKEISYSGAKVENKLTLHFHEHVQVDSAPQGTYEVHITVEDQQGRTNSNKGIFTK